MKKNLLSLLLLICFIPVYSQHTFLGSLASSDPTFNRPDVGTPPTTLSAIGTDVTYDVITIDVPATGVVTFYSLSVWDNFTILYGQDGFNPASPLTNALIANDDFGGPNSGFSYNFTTAGTYYLVICSFKNGVTGSYIVTQSAAVVLPLKLLSFTAVKTSGNSNLIKWSSAEESSLISYEVQHSIDGKTFNDLKDGKIAAKNNSGGTAYSFTDKSPLAGNNYYRLKITERSGRSTFSPVAVVKNGRLQITDLKVYPNPASDYLQIEVKSMPDKKAFVSVINSAGEIVQKGQYIFNNQSLLSVDIKKLPAGKYFLKATFDDEVKTIVFIKN